MHCQGLPEAHQNVRIHQAWFMILPARQNLSQPYLLGTDQVFSVGFVKAPIFMWKAGLPLSFSHKYPSTFLHTFAYPRLFPDNTSWGRRDCFFLIWYMMLITYNQGKKLKASKGGHPNGNKVTVTERIQILVNSSISRPPTHFQQRKKRNTSYQTQINSNRVRPWPENPPPHSWETPS